MDPLHAALEYARESSRLRPRPQLKVLGILGLFIVAAVITTFVERSFVEANNLESLLRRTSLYAIIGIGVAFVILTGGIDLSIGSVMALVGCLLALLIQPKYAAVDQAILLEMTEGNNYALIDGDFSRFRAGDQVHLTPESGADKQVLTIARVEYNAADTSFSGNARPITTLEFTTPNKATVSVGFITRATKLLEFHPETGTIVLDGTGLAPVKRDRLTLFGADGTGLASFTISQVSGPTERLTVTLAKTEALAQASATQSQKPKAFATLDRYSSKMTIATALPTVLGLAALIGLAHGLLITKLKLPSFIVTLCGLMIYRGVIRTVTSEQTQGFGIIFDDLRYLATGRPFSIPVPFIGWISKGTSAPFFTPVHVPMPFVIMTILAIVAAIVLNRTIFGRYLKALGRNEQAARYSGINTDRTVIAAYVICALCAGIGGILSLLDVNTGQPSDFGNSYELYAIAAAVLGGCSLRGGEGAILGVVIGAAILPVLSNSILLLGIPTTMEYAIIGAVILVGVIADELVRRFAAKRRAVRSAG